MSDKTPEQKQDCVASQMAVDWYIRLLTEEPAVAIKEAYQVGYQAAKPQWISVKARLPEEGVEVLIFGKVLNDISKTLGVRARFQGDQTWKYTWESEDIHIYTQDDVTHWMPLPEAPKGEK